MTILERVYGKLKSQETVQLNSDVVSHSCNMSRIYEFEWFLPLSLMEKLRNDVNRVLFKRKQVPVSIEEIPGVIILHVIPASYSTSVYTVTAAENADIYFPTTYLRVSLLSGLVCFFVHRGEEVNNRNGSTGSANKPSRGNALITGMENEVGTINRCYIYVGGATMFSLEEDHQRQSSKAVTTFTNLWQVDNPVKVFGPVNNALCSALNPFVLANHYTRSGERIIHVWDRLFSFVHGGSY